jgi:predicted outer membrane repeat protein
MTNAANSRIWQAIHIVLILALICPVTCGKVIYVDDDATGTNDGSSWDNAYVHLQNALTDANDSVKPVEIRVATGVYVPYKWDHKQSIMMEDLEISFRLISNVALLGGYAGLSGQDPNARDIAGNRTVLSGNIADYYNITQQPGKTAIKSYTIVSASEVDANALLDGFTITDAQRTSMDNSLFSHPTINNCIFTSDYNSRGMSNRKSNPTITNCVFRRHAQDKDGAGIYNDESNPKLTNCVFEDNDTRENGAAMYNRDSDPVLNNCTFNRNHAQKNGGGMFNFRCKPTFINCNFTRNTASYNNVLGGNSCGGGLYNASSEPNLVNCIFSSNHADDEGGGMYNDGGSATLKNCTFENNYTLNTSGGGIYCIDCTLTVTNCTFTENNANGISGRMDAGSGGGLYTEQCDTIISNSKFISNRARFNGGGIFNEAGYFTFNEEGYLTIVNCTFAGNEAMEGGGIFGDNVTMVNSILWGNAPEQISSNANVSYCDIEGGLPGNGVGIINADPLFADSNNSDYHLKSEYGRWDPNSESWVLDNITSPCINAGDPASIFEMETMPNGERINMGAYGGTIEASRSPHDVNNIPYYAYEPFPSDGSTDVNSDVTLSWTSGFDAVLHDVYLGTYFNDVNNATATITYEPNGVYKGRYDTNSYDIDTPLYSGESYYWRVDEIDSQGNKTTGKVWTFITEYGGTKGRGCFIGKTLVWVDDEPVTLSNLTNDRIVNGIVCNNSIEDIQEHEGIFICYDVLLESGNCIVVAENHYFMEESGQWIGLQNLKTGTRLRTSEGAIRILSITRQPIPYSGKVYNLKIKNSDQYLVGKDAVIVRDY